MSFYLNTHSTPNVQIWNKIFCAKQWFSNCKISHGAHWEEPQVRGMANVYLVSAKYFCKYILFFLLNMCFVSLKSPAFKFPRSISWHEVKRMLMLRPWKTWIKLLYESSIKLAAVLCRLLYQSACHTTVVLSSPLSSHSVSIQLVSNTFTILDYTILTSKSLPQHCERYHLNHHQLRRRRFYIYIYFEKKNNQRTFTFFCCSKNVNSKSSKKQKKSKTSDNLN